MAPLNGRNFFKILGIVLASVVVLWTVGFFAVKWHWTDVSGIVDAHSNELQRFSDQVVASQQNEQIKMTRVALCKASVMGSFYPVNAQKILDTYERTRSSALLVNMVEAIVLRSNGTEKAALWTCDDGKEISNEEMRHDWIVSNRNAFPWMNTEDWETFKGAVIKDSEVIGRVSRETGVEPRLIVAQLVAEQLRLFNSDRAVYKRFFAPLKMLGSETKFSLGVTGVKEETAIKIENNLKDATSPFYPGAEYAHLLDFATDDIKTERYDRITDEHDHYYSYLYTALYLKQIMHQWNLAGYDISHRPEILSTLFNIGFARSNPNPSPQTGGAMIEIAGATYSFGSLGYEFYYSGELMDAFPYGL